jgi:hypothetical protein
VGLLDSNEVWVTLFSEKRTNADVTIGSPLCGGLLRSDPLVRPTAARHADPLPKSMLCVAASDPALAISLASLASPLSLLSETVGAPAERDAAPTESPWSSPPYTCCATCSPCTSPDIDLQPTPTADLATLVSILDNPDTDVTW